MDLTKPNIDWSHVAPKFKWLVREPFGVAYLFTGSKPEASDFGWDTKGEFCECKGFASYTPGTCDWKDSLVERPE